jgi:hypothetical protein
MRMLLVLCALLLPLCLTIAGAAAAAPPSPLGVQALAPASPLAPTMQNPNMECANGGFVPQDGILGLVPIGWTALLLDGQPSIDSARHRFLGSCWADGGVERLEGDDALVMAAQDIETNPDPGKHFDALIYQRVAVTPGQTYSLSAWAVGFCGGSFNEPNDCPAPNYIAKMAGLDPTGGTDPNAPSVIWTENRQNFNEVKWANLRLAATAAQNSSSMTVFLRISSPLTHHGNHALFDAVSLMGAPSAQFGALPAQVNGRSALITWDGALNADILAIPPGAYRLYFEIQSRLGSDGAWQDLLMHTEARSTQFTSQVPSGTYFFRVRALADQPSGVPRAQPNQRYVSEWLLSPAIDFTDLPPVAINDNVTTLEDTPIQIPVLANDSDPNPGSTLSISSAGPAQYGRVSNDGQHVDYSPDPDYNGTDVFTYTITDGGLVSAPGTVTVTVTPVDDPPRVRNAGTRMNAVGETVSSWLGVYDPESEPLTITATGLPPELTLDKGSSMILGTLTADAGNYRVTITATDPQATTTVSFDWLVLEQVWRTHLPVLARQ